MVLTVEGSPDDSLLSAGGLGNAKRVGHDISPLWGSMLSLVDIGSGLWRFAHNSTNATFGGYWNGAGRRAPECFCCPARVAGPLAWHAASSGTKPISSSPPPLSDLDMIEIGNAPDFACSQDADSLTRCQTHFT